MLVFCFEHQNSKLPKSHTISHAPQQQEESDAKQERTTKKNFWTQTENRGPLTI